MHSLIRLPVSVHFATVAQRRRSHPLSLGIVVFGFTPISMKERGGVNDLIDRLRSDPDFALIHDELDTILDPHAFVGRAPEQVHQFLEREARPALAGWKSVLGQSSELTV